MNGKILCASKNLDGKKIKYELREKIIKSKEMTFDIGDVWWWGDFYFSKSVMDLKPYWGNL